MKLHPAVVASELKTYTFFKSFGEDLLLQVSTMTDLLAIKQGEYILKEGELNHCLFFIRSGKAEVVLAGEVVASLSQRGEVFGEMSVVSGSEITTTIRAATDLECFVIDSRNFIHVHPKDKEHFAALLYRIYSIILVDRLSKTNEKARLFEIANRELYQAQQSLVEYGEKKVLLVESDKKQLVLAKMAVGGTGVQLETATDLESAQKFLDTESFDLVLCNHTCIGLLENIKSKCPQTKLIYLADKEHMQTFDAIKKNPEIWNLVARDNENRTETVRTILSAISKTFSKDPFGLEKYLTTGITINTKMVKSSDQRNSLREDLGFYLSSLGFRKTIIERCDLVAEELLMNAVYDAPTDAQGKAIYNHLQRNQEVFLDTHQQAILRYACDGVTFAISVTDPFGSLSKETLVHYLEKCYSGVSGHEENMIAHKGGAGRGLHQIIENSDLTVFNVKKGIRTEVICLFYVESKKREALPSFHFFFS